MTTSPPGSATAIAAAATAELATTPALEDRTGLRLRADPAEPARAAAAADGEAANVAFAGDITTGAACVGVFEAGVKSSPTTVPVSILRTAKPDEPPTDGGMTGRPPEPEVGRVFCCEEVGRAAAPEFRFEVLEFECSVGGGGGGAPPGVGDGARMGGDGPAAPVFAVPFPPVGRTDRCDEVGRDAACREVGRSSGLAEVDGESGGGAVTAVADAGGAVVLTVTLGFTPPEVGRTTATAAAEPDPGRGGRPLADVGVAVAAGAGVGAGF